MLLRTVEAFADVFHGILQKQWRLDIVGRSSIYRGIILLATFALTYHRLGRLSTAIFLAAVLTAVTFLLYDLRSVHKIADISCQFHWGRVLALSRDCFPVLGYSLFLNSIVLAARFFIEQYHGEEMLGYYGSVSTIAVIVQTASNLILTPFNGMISEYYAQGRQQEIRRLCGKVALLLVALTGAR